VMWLHSVESAHCYHYTTFTTCTCAAHYSCCGHNILVFSFSSTTWSEAARAICLQGKYDVQ